MSAKPSSASDTTQIHLLSPEAAYVRPGHSRSRSTTGAGLGLSRTSLRPSFDSMKQRISGVFSLADVPKLKIAADAERRLDSTMNRSDRNDSETCWRPVPFALQDDESRDLYFMKTEQDLVEIVDHDKTRVLFHTNLPHLSRATISNMPKEILMTSTGTEASPSTRPSATVIKKVGDELLVHIKGLEPVKFYRARPDCIFPVDCFTAQQTLKPHAVASRSEFGSSVGTTVNYAWKNTSMVGKGGLKLVDLRDNEVLAYFEWTSGRSFAKVHIQGSGLRLNNLVVATILALKYQHVMRTTAESEETGSVCSPVDKESISSGTYSH